jgi:hypothetical protein
VTYTGTSKTGIFLLLNDMLLIDTASVIKSYRSPTLPIAIGTSPRGEGAISKVFHPWGLSAGAAAQAGKREMGVISITNK